MKVYIVVQNWTGMEVHNREYVDCFIDAVDAYKKALAISGDIYKPEVIEKEFDFKNKVILENWVNPEPADSQLDSPINANKNKRTNDTLIATNSK